MFKKVLVLIVFLLSSINVFGYTNSDIDNNIGYFNHIHVDLQLRENGIIEVTETRNTTFLKPVHGIYYVYNQRSKFNYNQKERQLKYNIFDIKVLSNHQYKIIEDTIDVIKVQIGDDENFVNRNEKYIIKYKILTTDLRIDNDIDILFNSLVHRIPLDTNLLTFKITGYKATNFKNIKFYKGKNSTVEFKNILLKTTDNSIEGKVLEKIKKDESFSLLNNLGSNYFNYIKAKDTNISIIFIIVATILLVIIYIFHYFKGKDKKIISPITMKIPKDINSLDVSYIYNNRTDNKGMLSLLFQLVNDKYITVKIDDSKFLVEKLKEYDGSDQALLKLMNFLFYDDYKINLKQDNRRFGKKLYKVFNELDEITTNKFKTEKKLYQKNRFLIILFTVITSILQIAYLLFAKYSIIKYLGDDSLYKEYGIIMLIDFIFLVLFNLALTLLSNKFYISFKNKYKIIIGSIITIAYCLMFLLNIIEFQMHIISINIFDILFAIVSYSNLYIIQFLSKRTEYANDTFGKVKGLHTFIKYAKEDKIKLLLDDNPNLFYDILPIAFAFGLTKKWLDIFKSIDYKISDIDNFNSLYEIYTLEYLSNINTNIDNLIPSYSEYSSNIFSSDGIDFSGSSDGGIGGGDSGIW